MKVILGSSLLICVLFNQGCISIARDRADKYATEKSLARARAKNDRVPRDTKIVRKGAIVEVLGIKASVISAENETLLVGVQENVLRECTKSTRWDKYGSYIVYDRLKPGDIFMDIAVHIASYGLVAVAAPIFYFMERNPRTAEEEDMMIRAWPNRHPRINGRDVGGDFYSVRKNKVVGSDYERTKGRCKDFVSASSGTYTLVPIRKNLPDLIATAVRGRVSFNLAPWVKDLRPGKKNYAELRFKKHSYTISFDGAAKLTGVHSQYWSLYRKADLSDLEKYLSAVNELHSNGYISEQELKDAQASALNKL